MLITFLNKIPDNRRKQGQRYQIAYILLFSILALLSNAKSYRQIHTFIKIHIETLKKIFKLKWKRVPSYCIIRELILSVNSKELEKVFREYAKEISIKKEKSNKQIKTISIDGKTLKGSFDHFEDQSAIQVLSAFLLEENIILAHEEIEKNKTNEIPMAQKLIEELELKNCIYIFDALHCQKKH